MTDIKAYLREYQGPPIRIMEVCGTHTAAIAESGIPSLLSPAVRLISGPGCPVCVTVTEYVDRLIELASTPSTAIVTFGDMMRVPGSRRNLNDIRSEGADIRMVYSPLDILAMAAAEPGRQFIFAAVGFETTTLAYAVLTEELVRGSVPNVRLLTSLKTMPRVLEWVLDQKDSRIDAFLAPGHVSVITGSAIYEPLAVRYGVPFAVAGFTGEEILRALYVLVRSIENNRHTVDNLYATAVTTEGRADARERVNHYFIPCDAAWRGIGKLPLSGMVLRPEYAAWDAGSLPLMSDNPPFPGCSCGAVIVGRLTPPECPLFGTVCTPENPAGACMVSVEGSCRTAYANRDE